MESRLSKLATRLRSLWSVFAGTVCDLGLMLLPMCRSSEVRYSPEHLAWMNRPHEPQFLGGPLDGMTEREAARLPFTWGRDQGEIWMQHKGHRYYHTPRGWRWAGYERVAT